MSAENMATPVVVDHDEMRGIYKLLMSDDPTTHKLGVYKFEAAAAKAHCSVEGLGEVSLDGTFEPDSPALNTD